MATLRHETDGAQNKHNVAVSVISVDESKQTIMASCEFGTFEIPFDELKRITPVDRAVEQGFWQGAEVEIACCLVKLNKNTEQPLHWYNAFTNTERQAIEVVYKEPNGNEVQKFLIDNNNGTGFYKVTKGKGSPRFPHASLGPCEIVRYLPADEWARVVDTDAIKFEDKVVQAYQAENFPEEYKVLKEKQQAMQEFRSMTVPQQLAYLAKLNAPSLAEATPGPNKTKGKKKRQRGRN